MRILTSIRQWRNNGHNVFAPADHGRGFGRGRHAHIQTGYHCGYDGLTDDYLIRLLKLTPVESVVLFIIAIGVIKSTPMGITVLLEWGVFLLLLVATPIFFMQRGVGTNQTVVLTLAFVAWAFAIGGPFTSLPWYQPVYGAAALAGFAAASPLFVR